MQCGGWIPAAKSTAGLGRLAISLGMQGAFSLTTHDVAISDLHNYHRRLVNYHHFHPTPRRLDAYTAVPVARVDSCSFADLPVWKLSLGRSHRSDRLLLLDASAMSEIQIVPCCMSSL